jgi:uncharacterized repeat protein (TIGR01451 family)
MKKLTSFLIVCILCSVTLQAQIVRAFTTRYNNPSVRGNIVYVANSIINTPASSGTGEVPPSGTSTNNAGPGAYINIETTPVTFINYGATWKYNNAGSLPAPQAGPLNWNDKLYSDAAWSSGATEIGFGGSQTTTITGQGTFVNNSGTTNDYYTTPNAIYTAYFRYSINIANPATYSGFTLNLLYDDGAVVYVNGVEVGRVNMAAGAVAYTTSASSNLNDATTTMSIAASSFAAGTNVVAVEVHRRWVLNAGVNRLDKDGTLSFDAQLIGQPISTVNSASSADLSLASCSQILWAGLYWGADQGTSGTNNAWMTGAEKSIKIMVPGSSTYQTVTAQQSDYHDATSSAIAGFNHTGYGCFANITSLLNATSPNGTYKVADMLGPVGINNACGGWTIVIAYENPSLVPRNLTVFDGHAIVDGGAAALDIGISGFLTPPSGTVSCELGAVVFDGDRSSLDAFQFKQNGAGGFYDLATTAAYALNGASDAWNSKISYKGSVVTTRSPAYYNTLGYDASIMDLPNAGNAQLSNNQTAATVRFSSPSENYTLQVLTTSVSQFNPEYVLTKSATDVNGATLVGGDILRYRIDYQNVGNDISNSSIIKDNIPSGATYKPGSLVINGVAKTDVSSDDQAEFDIVNNRVVFRVGTGATSAAGGQVAASASGYIQFDVYAPQSCAVLNCVSTLSNSGRIDYIGATSLAALYDSTGTTASGCFVLGPITNAVAGSCYVPKDTILVNMCPSTSVTFPIQQYGGYQFYSTTPFTSANQINPATTYNSSRIIYAYWNNGTCSDTVIIRIFITPCPDIDDDNDGIPDYVEGNNSAAFGDHDSDGVPNYLDAQYPGYVDNNADGINDNFDPSGDSDNDGIPNFLDANFPGFVDANGDGVNDNFDADSDGIPNHLDLDSDNDGIPDVVESFGVDANGDGRIDNYTDTDNDGLSQNVDGNNTGTSNSGLGLGAIDTDGDGIPNYLDLDSDNDGIPDVIEAGGTDTNNDGIIDNYSDTDGDGFSDTVDGDVGNDTVAENAANALLRTGSDGNNDGRADSFPYKNMDADTKANPYDLDSDGDGIADVREARFTDANNDGKVDGSVNARGWNTTIAAMGVLVLPNTDGVGNANYLDIDSDDDGIPDNIEGQTTIQYTFPSGIDTDFDGLDNAYDNIIGFGGKGIVPVDTDGDTEPDYVDADTDGDGMLDIVEGNDFNLNKMPDDLVTLTGLDTDGDGLDNRFDQDNASAKGTSLYMGNGGTTSGDASPGGKTMVQKSHPAFYDRDWRNVDYVLFIDFIDFKAVLQNKKVQLKWTVQEHQETDHFVVERSIDKTNFSPVVKMKANNTQNQTQTYQATDDVSMVNAPSVFYRLIAVSVDGKTKISPVLQVRLNSLHTSNVQVMPVPIKANATISVETVKAGTADFTIVDMQGKVVSKFTQTLNAGTNSFTFEKGANLPSGFYYVNMNFDGTLTSCRFQVVK